MVSHVDYSVSVSGNIGDVFTAFLSHERLLHRGVYAEASWIEGEPWQVGSRARYMVIKPVPSTIAAVVTVFNPPRHLSVINHGLGITVEQNVYFSTDSGGGTRVRMTMEFLGDSPVLTQREVLTALEFVTHDMLDNLVGFCRKLAAGA